jgi:hypothetical protein
MDVERNPVHDWKHLFLTTEGTENTEAASPRKSQKNPEID